jgi:hypothetical protein
MKSQLLFILFAFIVLLQACSDSETVAPPNQKFILRVELQDDPEFESELLEGAKASFFKNGIEQFNYTLGASTNEISFKGDPAASYTLVVKKDGYLPYASQFRFDELSNGANLKSVISSLKSVRKAKVFSLMPTGDFAFWLAFNQSGSVTVDWGDGTIEKIDFTVEEGSTSNHLLQHDYAENPYPVVVKGDLNKIVEFGLDPYVYSSAISYVNTDNLPELANFYISESTLLLLDLHKNTKLQSLEIPYNEIGQVKLPAEHAISHIAVTDLKLLNKKGIEAIVKNIHTNAVAKNIKEGTFLINMVKISAKAEQNLQHLESVLTWNVYRE